MTTDAGLYGVDRHDSPAQRVLSPRQRWLLSGASATAVVALALARNPQPQCSSEWPPPSTSLSWSSKPDWCGLRFALALSLRRLQRCGTRTSRDTPSSCRCFAKVEWWHPSCVTCQDGLPTSQARSPTPVRGGGHRNAERSALPRAAYLHPPRCLPRWSASDKAARLQHRFGAGDQQAVRDLRRRRPTRPGQLRMAAESFAEASAAVACLQGVSTTTTTGTTGSLGPSPLSTTSGSTCSCRPSPHATCRSRWGVRRITSASTLCVT